MKKWISYVLLSALLITALPSFVSRAAETDCTGTLTLDETNANVGVSLSVPQAATEDITSLRFRLNVSVQTGKMDAPVFNFADTVKSELKDSKTMESADNSSYIVDVILSGKKDQVIFPKNGQADIGTISLKPSSDSYKISVNFTGINNNSESPAAEYVTDEGQLVQTVSLVDTKQVTIEKTSGQTKPTGSSSSYVPSGSGSGSGSNNPGSTNEPDASASPSATTAPDNTDSPSPASTPGATNGPSGTNPGTTAEPGNTQQPSGTEEPVIYDTQTKPSLSVSITEGSRQVKFSWDTIKGADGYIIYSTTSKSGKYNKLKTISNPDKTSCNIKMDYASSYWFKIRAFKAQEDGNNIFGKYSNVKSLTTAPAKLKNLKAKISGTKVNLSWKKVKNADGYQIYSSKKKNGSYSLIKTVKKGSVLAKTVKKSQKNTYFKARAYVKNADGKRVYGNFCTNIKVK